MTRIGLPRSVVEEDHALEKAAERTSVALMEHRWHWTLDESNPERVSMREYARQIGRENRVIQRYANGFVIWRDASGGVSPEEARARASMSVETEAATEAVAEARGLQFGYVTKEFGSEVRHVREVARQRAEEKGTSITDELPQVAAFTYKAERVEQERTAERRRREPLRHIQIEARLLDAQRALIRAIQESEGVDLSPESRDLLRETLDNVKRLIVIADRAIVDAYDQSWRQEFRLIEGGLAAS